MNYKQAQRTVEQIFSQREGFTSEQIAKVAEKAIEEIFIHRDTDIIEGYRFYDYDPIHLNIGALSTVAQAEKRHFNRLRDNLNKNKESL